MIRIEFVAKPVSTKALGRILESSLKLSFTIWLRVCFVMTSVRTNLVTRDRIRSFKFSYMKKTSGRFAWNNVKNGSNNSVTLNVNCKMAGHMRSAR